MDINEKMIKSATFTSVWDAGYEITTNCKVNLATREVFDIEVNDSNNIEALNELDREYITIDGEEYDVYNTELYDVENNNVDFWYGNEIEVKYPLLSVCTDYIYLLENLSDEALEALEGILEDYGKGKIDIEIVRDENDEIKFEESFNLIVNDKDYKQSGFEALALKWYESFEDTGYLVECFKDAFETNYYHFTVDYNENGQKKSYEINVGAKEKPGLDAVIHSCENVSKNSVVKVEQKNNIHIER